jgi:hypothetical protein
VPTSRSPASRRRRAADASSSRPTVRCETSTQPDRDLGSHTRHMSVFEWHAADHECLCIPLARAVSTQVRAPGSVSASPSAATSSPGRNRRPRAAVAAATLAPTASSATDASPAVPNSNGHKHPHRRSSRTLRARRNQFTHDQPSHHLPPTLGIATVERRTAPSHKQPNSQAARPPHRSIHARAAARCDNAPMTDAGLHGDSLLVESLAARAWPAAGYEPLLLLPRRSTARYAAASTRDLVVSGELEFPSPW